MLIPSIHPLVVWTGNAKKKKILEKNWAINPINKTNRKMFILSRLKMKNLNIW